MLTSVKARLVFVCCVVLCCVLSCVVCCLVLWCCLVWCGAFTFTFDQVSVDVREVSPSFVVAALVSVSDTQLSAVDFKCHANGSAIPSPCWAAFGNHIHRTILLTQRLGPTMVGGLPGWVSLRSQRSPRVCQRPCRHLGHAWRYGPHQKYSWQYLASWHTCC